jgi:hypothetical protein
VAVSGKQPFEVDDFSLGITDDAFERDPKYSLELDNFNIEPDGSLLSRYGSVVEDTANPQVPNGAKRIGALINYDNSAHLLVQSEDKVYYRNTSAYTTITGATSNDVFSVGTESNNTSYAQWNKQIYITNDGFPSPMKIYKDSGGVFRVVNNGLPALATAPTVTPGAGANSYIYAFHYFFSYTVGSQTFEDVGPVTEVTISSAAAPNVDDVAITNIPVLANGSDDNYATSTIKVQIFRTINAGTTFYKVGEVTNGTNTFNDSTSDTTLQSNVLMYTEDGTVEFDPVPKHKFVHVVNNIAYYGFIQESSIDYPFKIRQSIPAAPSAAPADFELDLEDEIKGLGSVNSIPIIFCKRHVYRIDGNFDQFGRGVINPIRISDTAGCISHLSIVSAEGQIFWAGNDGFYASDGYRVIKISDKINSRYLEMKEQSDDVRRIYGTFDEENRRIQWAIQQDNSNNDNDSIANLDLRWGIRDHSTFTTWSGFSFRCSSLVFFDDKLYRGDDNGYVYYHDTGTLTDPRVDLNVSAANWERETIIWLYRSCNYNFGSMFFRKKPTRILLLARNIGNTSIQITSVDDDGKRERELKPIRWRRNFVWGDDLFVWGDVNCVWNKLGVIEQWRRFPARGLRLSMCQIQISNAYTVISNSDSRGEATFNGTANTATLVNAATYDWPTDSVDYFLSTENDSYVSQYKVLTRSADVLTVIDSGSNLPTGQYEWLLKGYRKGEPLNLQGYCIHVSNVDQNQITYETGDDGANA